MQAYFMKDTAVKTKLLNRITVLQRYLGLIMQCRGWQCFQKRLRQKKQDFFRKNEKRLAREQRKLSRCVRGSHNYELQKKKVARCHEKIRNQRRDHLHKLSRKIADGYDAVAVEDIDMKAMGQCLHFGKAYRIMDMECLGKC